MSHYLLDTNHLSPLVTLSHPLRQRFFQHYYAGHTFGLAVPALTETLFGLSLLPRARQNLLEWNKVRTSLVIIRY